MWPFKKKPQERFKWIDVGAENPFTAPIMDIRELTLNNLSMTKDPAIAKNFAASRSDDGQQYIGTTPTDPISVRTEITYPHNGEKLDGIVFKAPAMEVKWDIYAYGEWFYFVRSWTSDLIYKVRYENTGEEMVLTEILASDPAGIDDDQIAAQNVHSIMQTHALGRVWPFHVPPPMHKSGSEEIALFLFSQFGSKATIATRENTLEIALRSAE